MSAMNWNQVGWRDNNDGRDQDRSRENEVAEPELLDEALRVLEQFAAKPATAHEPAEWAVARAVVARAKQGGLL